MVYGAPGLAAGIERGVSAESPEPSPRGSPLELGGKVVLPRGDGDDLERAFHSLLHVLPLPEPLKHGFRLVVTTEIAPGGGLGCSAAIGASIGRAIELCAHQSESKGEAANEGRALERANAWERVFHGNPSGIDTAAALSGGFFRFIKSEGATQIKHPHDLWFAVGYSGSSASTKTMVEGIAKIKEKHPVQVEKFLTAVNSLSRNAELAISAGDVNALGQLLDLNQMLLAGLLLSTEEIERMREIGKEAGALGVKLTGSGGGGSVIALAADRAGADKVAEAWNQAGFKSFATRVPGKRGEAP